MHEMGVFKGEQLRELSRTHLVRVFGKAGNVYYDFARGIDERPVVVHHDRKSVGCERTFLEDLHIESAIVIELYHITLDLVERLSKSGFEGRTLTLKLKWDATTQITRSLTQEKILRKKADILLLAKRLLAETDYKNRPIRLMGLSVSSPVSEDEAFNKKPIWIEGDLPFVDFM